MNLDNLWQLLDKGKFSKKTVSGSRVVLEESGAEHPYQFDITDLSDNTVVIKCPSSQEGFFDSEKGKAKDGDLDKKGYTKICDYLIFIPNDQKVTVIFCELKNSLSEYQQVKDRISQQIKSTVPLMKYMLAGVETHFGDEWEVGEMHYAIIVNEKNDKGEISSPKKEVKEIYYYKNMQINTITGVHIIPIQELTYKQI